MNLISTESSQSNDKPSSLGSFKTLNFNVFQEILRGLTCLDALRLVSLVCKTIREGSLDGTNAFLTIVKMELYCLRIPNIPTTMLTMQSTLTKNAFAEHFRSASPPVLQEIRRALNGRNSPFFVYIAPMLVLLREDVFTARQENNSQKLVSLSRQEPDIPKALEIAKLISDENGRNYALGELSERVQDIPKALEIIKLISRENERNWKLRELSKRVQDIPKALEIIKLISCENKRNRALEELSERVRDIPKALEIIKLISCENERNRALEFLSIKEPNKAKALEIFKLISDEKIKDLVITFIVIQELNNAKVLEIAQLISDEKIRNIVLEILLRKEPNKEKAFKIALLILQESKKNITASKNMENERYESFLREEINYFEQWPAAPVSRCVL